MELPSRTLANAVVVVSSQQSGLLQDVQLVKFYASTPNAIQIFMSKVGYCRRYSCLCSLYPRLHWKKIRVSIQQAATETLCVGGTLKIPSLILTDSTTLLNWSRKTSSTYHFSVSYINASYKRGWFWCQQHRPFLR